MVRSGEGWAGTEKPRRTAPNRLLTIIAFNVLIVVILLSAVEGYLRVATANELYFLFSEPRMRLDGRGFVVPHPSRGFALKPGYRDDEIEIDNRGFRSTGTTASSPTGNAMKVLVLGESTTFGWGVPQGLDYPSLLQSELASRTGLPVEVINGGVPAYSSTQVAITLEELLRDGMAVDLVLICNLWNDVYYSATPNWYPELLVYQQPPFWRRFLFRHSATFRHFARLQIDRMGEVDVLNPEALEVFKVNLQRMLAVRGPQMPQVVFVESPCCRKRMDPRGMLGLGIRYTPEFMTARLQEYADSTRELAARFGSLTVDHRVSIRHDPPADLFIDQTHPNAVGNAMMAEDIATALLDIGLIEPQG